MPASAWGPLPSVLATPGRLLQAKGVPRGALARPQASAGNAATEPLLPHSSPSLGPGLPSERPTHRRRWAFVAALITLVLAIMVGTFYYAVKPGGGAGGSSGGTASSADGRSGAQNSGGGSYPVSFFAVSEPLPASELESLQARAPASKSCIAGSGRPVPRTSPMLLAPPACLILTSAGSLAAPACRGPCRWGTGAERAGRTRQRCRS